MGITTMTVIMWGSSYGTQQWSTRERERYNMLLPPTHSPGVDYSLFMEMNARSLFVYICVSAALSFAKSQGTLYIVSFRSNPTIWDQNGQQTTLEEGTSMGGVVSMWDRATCARLSLGDLLRYFFSLRDTGKNINSRKILVRFEFRKVPES